MKRDIYEEDEIMMLDYDDGETVECGVMGVFECNGKEYIALDDLDDNNMDVYLYEYIPTEEDFELVDIPEEDFEAVSAEFDRLMEEA